MRRPFLSSLLQLMRSAFIRSSAAIALFIIVLAVGALLRVDAFRLPYYQYNYDYNRDYLVAHHMVQYGEHPLTGPMGQLGTILPSPAYFYFLALPLLIKDDIIFLGIFNVLLQIAAVILIYLLAKELFGRKTAIVAMTIFAFSQKILEQSLFLWAPHVMQPFALLSYVLLLMSHYRKSVGLLFSGIGVFLFAMTLHYSVLAAAPIFFYGVHLALRRMNGGIWHYTAVGTFSLFAIFLLHFPSFFYAAGHSSAPMALSPFWLFGDLRLSMLLNRFIARAPLFFNSFFIYKNLTLVLFLWGGLITAGVAYFLSARIHDLHKRTVLFLIVGVLSFHFVAALIPDIADGQSFPIRYYTPIFSIFFILIAEMSTTLVTKRFWSAAWNMIVAALLIYAFSPNPLAILRNAARNFQHPHSTASPVQDAPPTASITSLFDRMARQTTTLWHPPYIPPPETEILKDEILTLQQQENRRDFLFFDVKTYQQDVAETWFAGFTGMYSNEMWWVPLERLLDTQLTIVDDKMPYDTRVLGDGTYVFILCALRNDVGTDYSGCADTFLREHQNYQRAKEIGTTTRFALFLARRTSRDFHPSNVPIEVRRYDESAGAPSDKM
ncbi:MAG: hypothetical protein AAB539_04755 [Patescibacteria group bacterium]